MKTIFTTLLVGIATIGIVFPWNTALAYDPYYTYPPYQQPVVTYQPEQAALLQQLMQLIQQLQMQLQNQGGTYYPPVYGGGGYTFYPTEGGNSSSNYKKAPEVETDDADNEDRDSAELNGSVDMNDFDSGIVFFVYGQDEDMVDDVADDYDEYRDVKDDEDGQDFMVIRVDKDLDGDDDYSEDVEDLDSDERYYFALCVEYDDEDGDETLECGKTERFDTDR